MRGHDVYESLAGAIALGEATDAERVRFEAHAAGCDRCREDGAGPIVQATIRRSAETETWRPSLGEAVLRAIALRRRGRVRAIGSAIATAAAFSVALDLGFSSGALGRLAARFAPPAADATPIAFVPKIPAGAAAPDVPAIVVPVAVHVRHHRHAIVRVDAPVSDKAAAVPAHVDEDRDLPSLDVFGGLAIDPEAEKRAPHVAKADPNEATP